MKWIEIFGLKDNSLIEYFASNERANVAYVLASTFATKKRRVGAAVAEAAAFDQMMDPVARDLAARRR